MWLDCENIVIYIADLKQFGTSCKIITNREILLITNSIQCHFSNIKNYNAIIKKNTDWQIRGLI